MSAPTVDVVIATYNRQPRLLRTLASLQRQSVSGFGLIVIDDGSSPPVADTVPQSLAAALGVRFFATGGNRGPAAARNLGIAASSADLIAFIDDDVDADPDWLETHLAHHARASEPTVTIGPLLAPADWKPTAWNRWEASKLTVEYERMERGEYAPTWRQFFTGNAVAPRRLLIGAGGFNEALRRAEDIELGLRLDRLGACFVFEPRAKGWHYAHRPRTAWLANAEAYAKVDVTIDRLYPELGWLHLIDTEMARRAPLSRAARSLATRLVGRSGAVLLAARAAGVLNRRPTTGLAVRAASLAYDIRYRAALDSVRRRPVCLQLPGTAPQGASPGTIETGDQRSDDGQRLGSEAVT